MLTKAIVTNLRDTNIQAIEIEFAADAVVPRLTAAGNAGGGAKRRETRTCFVKRKNKNNEVTK